MLAGVAIVSLLLAGTLVSASLKSDRVPTRIVTLPEER